ncbi:hypothetical protein CSO01_15300 [Cellulomonas soli]|uniref:Uncharacterized protein n=1 Tax=Cellulomonas soli TaxID=931535 RepID=A0A512PC76_9CELL|nr:undecaprenyl diphosphate synthase [Cellulomonas soli]GEP68815.1 hypothetical protein CSO01_15300 [Cellulomonas soli]
MTLAIGYDAHDEIVDAVRAVLRDAAATADGNLLTIAESITPELIDARIASAGSDIDLVIRTSGEQRLSGFFPWRSADAELLFVDVHWPAFTYVGFLRALRTYGQRRHRQG